MSWGDGSEQGEVERLARLIVDGAGIVTTHPAAMDQAQAVVIRRYRAFERAADAVTDAVDAAGFLGLFSPGRTVVNSDGARSVVANLEAALERLDAARRALRPLDRPSSPPPQPERTPDA